LNREHALVLAAGAGRRFGGRKLLAQWRGRPLIAWSVDAALASGVEAVTVVLGADADEIAACLPAAVGRVVCDDWAEGMAASLRCGIAALPPATSAVAIFLGDMPDVSPALARLLLDAVKAGAPAAVATFDGTPAHPVAIGSAAFAMVRSLSGDRGARSELLSLPGTKMIATDLAGSTFDIDLPADISRSGDSRSSVYE
jgi:molybdenum cofactor cytidylyltransferase